MASPLARMLALSLSLHGAVLALVQPAPGDARPVLVIQARLAEPPSPAPPLPVPATPTVPPAPPEPPSSAVAEDSGPPEPAPPQTVSSPPAAPAPGPRPVAVPADAPPAPSRGSEGADDALPRVPVPFDTRWYAAREVDVLPKPVEKLRYEYPERARERGVQGSVVVLLKVDELGRVRDVEVLESTPPGEFDAIVLEVLRRAAFTPARRDGVPVRTLIKHRVSFELDD